MAKRKTEAAEPAPESWSDVSAALAKMGRLQLALGKYKLDKQTKMQAIQEEYQPLIEPLEERIKAIWKQVERFTRKHKAELGDKKSHTLYYGTVYLRETQKVIIPQSKVALAEIVIRLKARGMDECIKSTPDSVRRDPLALYSPEVIKEVGATLKVEDSFSCTVNEERLADV